MKTLKTISERRPADNKAALIFTVILSIFCSRTDTFRTGSKRIAIFLACDMERLSRFFIASLFFFVAGCRQGPASHSEHAAISSPPGADSGARSDHPPTTSTSRTDSLLEQYLLLSRNVLVRAAVDKKLSEEWLFDQALDTDTARYLIYQIGHDVTDEGGSNPRFITDQWVYVDTIGRILYEYDLANDSLVRWTK